MTSKGKKRALEEIMQQNIYKFKIGLPGGVTVDLNLIDPPRESMRFEDFIDLVKKKYLEYKYQNPTMCEREVNWNGKHVYLEDEDDNRLKQRIDFDNFEPNKFHLLKFHVRIAISFFIYTFISFPKFSIVFAMYLVLVHLPIGGKFACFTVEIGWIWCGSRSDENIWDLTPDIELLRELPEEYAFETALADLIDNSLQAVWSISRNNRRFISIDIKDDRISLFDTGPGMDNSIENNISKWGKMGASLHRSSKEEAIGGQPPYLMPNFGMFGYGGPMASMHLGRRAIVSSKTKESAKVYVLCLEREALLRKSSSKLSWKCDDLSKEGKTTTPIKFQVNGVGLAEIEGGEVSVTNLFSCNGPEFFFSASVFL